MTSQRQDYSFQKRRPDKCQMPIRYQVIRVPKHGLSGVICLSHDLIGFDTHFTNRRTSICIGDCCSKCAAGESKRWYGWLAIANRSLSTTGLIQITAAAAGNVDQAFRKHRTLKGLIFDFHRRPATPNGRLYVDVHDVNRKNQDLPNAPDVTQIIMHMMGVTPEQLQQANSAPTLHLKKAD